MNECRDLGDMVLDANGIGSFRFTCERANVLYCYGAGYVGKLVASILSIWKIDFAGYVVTNLDDSTYEIKDKPVYLIDDVKCQEDAVFIVAVTKKYQQEILVKLQEKGVRRYICINSDWLKWINNKVEFDKYKQEYRANKEFAAGYSPKVNVPKGILHIICKEKFTTGYINFMKIKMTGYKHFFAVIGGFENEVHLIDNENVICLESYADLRSNTKIRGLIKDVDKIVISGVWVGDMGIYPQTILDKVYLHFWGGDFYDLRYKDWQRKHMTHIQRRLKKRLLSRCHANIFLIPSEKEAYQTITGIHKPCFVAPMPENPIKPIYDFKYEKVMKKMSKPRIAVGNSATKENHHVEVFEMLAKWKNQIEVICPLSYGDPHYRKQVIESGGEFLGDSFKPIVDFMDIQSFIDLLATCTVGIYYNDRQQAGGNIYINLRLGNKLYLRKGTSMWKNYVNMGVTLYDVKDIKNEEIDRFLAYSNKIGISNNESVCRYFSMENAQKQWRNVLNSL